MQALLELREAGLTELHVVGCRWGAVRIDGASKMFAGMRLG